MILHAFLFCAHVHLSVLSPVSPVHFIGELVSCTGFLPPRLSLTTNRLSSLSAHWSIESSADQHWRPLDGGETSGKTWLAQRESPSEKAMWNSPIDCTFACSSLDGWPQLLVTVMETDTLERQDLGGYGIVRLPTTPGEHYREIPISRPRGTWSEAFSAFFVGGRPRYDHPLVLATPNSRYGHETVSMGLVQLKISVAMQGMDTHETRHVRFDTAQGTAAQEAASVCLTCTRSSTSGGGKRGGDDEDDEEDTNDRQSLLRKSQ